MLIYENDSLVFEGVRVDSLAKNYSTPTFIYSKNKIYDGLNTYTKLLSDNTDQDSYIVYPINCCSNINILNLIAYHNNSHILFLAQSEIELEKLFNIKIPSNRIIYDGLLKNEKIVSFLLKNKINNIYLDNLIELTELNKIASNFNEIINLIIKVKLTNNDDNNLLKDESFMQSGIEMPLIYKTFDLIKKNYKFLKPIGLSFELPKNFNSATINQIVNLVNLIAKANNLMLVNITYDFKLNDHQKIHTKNFALEKILNLIKNSSKIFYLTLPSLIIKQHAVLITKVISCKKQNNKNFIIIDAIINNQSFYNLIQVNFNPKCQTKQYSIIDSNNQYQNFLVNSINLEVEKDSLLILENAGYYDFNKPYNYQGRINSCEILITDKKLLLIKQKQSFSNQLELEKLELNSAKIKK